MITRRTFLKQLVGSAAACVAASLVVSGLPRKFPDDWSVDEVNEHLFFRGLRPCPHSEHSSDEDFAECTGLARRGRFKECT
jgi:hypothetical protein